MPDGDPVLIGRDNIANNPGAETVLRRAGNSDSADPVFTVRTPVRGDGIHGEARFGTGVQGTSNTGGIGVEGLSPTGFGVRGFSTNSNGVRGSSTSSFGVAGDSFTGTGVAGSSSSNVGVFGFSSTVAGVSGLSTSGIGVAGSTSTGAGVIGRSTSGNGVAGTGTVFGVAGVSPSFMGVSGTSTSGFGVRGLSTSNFGVVGVSTTSRGVSGISTSGFGVSGISGTGAGVRGTSTSGAGVTATSTSGAGVSATSTSGAGVTATSTTGIGMVGRGPVFAAVFFGNVVVAGIKLFKIDHPLAPENKYLLHACVESSEMKNLYDGVARLGPDGAAWIELPEWFEALNGDLRYQLTAIGESAPGLHIAEELSENRFKIEGGEAGMRVCWQVTGTRKDRWAAAYPFEVEQEKNEEERGRYLEPSLYDAPEEQRVIIGAPATEAEEYRPAAPSDADLARLDEETLGQLDEWRQLAEEQRGETVPPSFDFAHLAEERLQLDEWRRLVDEQHRETEELRRRMEGQEETPPEST